jgi:uncharacterized membrane protein YfcA
VPYDADLFYAVLAPTAAVAGLVRGFAGFGGPLLMLPVLNGFLPPATSLWVMMWVDLLVNVRLLPDARHHASLPVLLPLTLGTLATMPIGVMLLYAVDAVVMKKVISAAILLAALVLLSGWRYRREAGPITWTAVGGLTGLVMGATSLAVTAALFLNAGNQTAAESRANFIGWVFIATIALLAMLAFKSASRPGDLQVILVLGALYLAGSILGSRWHRQANEVVVRRIVLAMVVLVATAGLFA